MIGKPDNGEAAPYYFNYINLVPDGADLLEALQGQLDEGRTLFSQISEEKSLYRYAPTKWSICEVLCHLNDAERVFCFRAFWFGRGFDSTLPSFDQCVSVSSAQADRIPWAAHVEEFEHVRRSTISLFLAMPNEVWLRSGVASDNRFTVRALAFVIAGHFSHHISLLRNHYL